MRELVGDLSAYVQGGLLDERAPFAPLPDHATAASVAAAPTFERRLWRVEVGLVKALSRRWAMEARYRWTPSADGEEARLADPGALWVPGFLGGFRAHGVSGAVSWRVPIDPWTLTLGATGGWASAIDGSGWWLRDTRQLGVRVVQRIPARKGGLDVEGSLTWAVRDLDASLWPIAALATLPGAPSLADQPPLRGAVGVSGGF